MDEALLQVNTMEKNGNVVLDIEALAQANDICCSGSPRTTRALSRKGSNRMERRGGEEHESEDSSKKLVVKVIPSQLEPLKIPLVQNRTPIPSPCTNPNLTEQDSKLKKFCRLHAFHPRKIVLLFATVSSLGTMILIYFTLAINRRGGTEI